MLLPYAEPERSNVMQMPSTPTAAPTPNAVPLQEDMVRATILVVEDEGGIRALVAKILKRESYKVVEAESAEEALEIVKQNGQPDLLLTDIMLPGMNGLQLAATMRNENPGLKVVYVSGYAGDEAAYGELPMGSRFLPKPFTLGALTSAVRETLFPE